MKINRSSAAVNQSYRRKFSSELLSKEEWKACSSLDIKYKPYLTSYEQNLYNLDKYYVSNLGRIAILDREGNLDILGLCAPSKNTNQISIKNNTYVIARLVALLFIDNDDLINKIYVCRKNHDIVDDSIDNIYWGTASDSAKNRKPRTVSTTTKQTTINEENTTTESSNKNIPHSIEPIVQLNIDTSFNHLYFSCNELKDNNINNTNNITRLCKSNEETNTCSSSIKEGFKWMYLRHYNSYQQTKDFAYIDLDQYVSQLKGDNRLILVTPTYKIIKVYESIYDILNDGYNLTTVFKSADNDIIVKQNNKQVKWIYVNKYLQLKDYVDLTQITQQDYKK